MPSPNARAGPERDDYIRAAACRVAQRVAARDQHDIAIVIAPIAMVGAPYRRRRDQRRIARYSSEEADVYRFVDLRRP